MRLRALPLPLRVVAAVVAIQVAIGTALRLVFWIAFRSTAGEASAGDWLQAWYLGLKFDLRLALLICLPLALASLIPALSPVRSGLMRRLWLGYLGVAQAAVFLFYFVDLGYYDYLRVRLDAESLDLLASLWISLGMVWETYPVVWGSLALQALTLGYGLMVRRFAFRIFDRPEGAPGRWQRRTAVGVFALLYCLAIYGKWSFYPLRWSDAYFGTEPFVSALALNPVLYFFDTFPNRGTIEDEPLEPAGYARVAELLEVESLDPAASSFARRVKAVAPLPGRPNLVVIHLESFATYKSGAYGNRLGATPHFDTMAERSIFFTNFFVPSGPTARAIFAMVTGIPDLNPLRSASRNPKAVRQHTVINALEGYDKFYFLGGSATWGNIRGLMAHNIEDLRIYEEGDYDLPRGDVWGLSDLHLFEAAHEVLRKEEQPFFALIQTAGNHRPYTIPEDRRGFELRELDEETLRDNGFENNAAFNGLRFLDHSLGRFLELAEQEDYFSNTVFAFYGDHGGPTPRATPWDRIALTTNHVPGVIYAPGFVAEGRRIAATGSLVDLLPTALSLIGVPYVNTTLGRDLLIERPAERRFALLSDGLITDDTLLRVDPQGVSRIYRYRESNASRDVAESIPEERDRLRGLYEQLQAASRHLLYNNPPR